MNAIASAPQSEALHPVIAYLRLLFAPTEEIAFLTFKKNEGEKDFTNYTRRTIQILTAENVQEMVKRNNEGYGGSVQRQPVSGGQRKGNIVKVRHAFSGDRSGSGRLRTSDARGRKREDSCATHHPEDQPVWSGVGR